MFEDAKDERVRIALSNSAIEKPYDLSFKYLSRTDQLVTDEESDTYQWGSDDGWNDTPPTGGDVMYVDAERVGPRALYPLAETFSRRGNVGARSELALAHLVSRQDFVFPEKDPRIGSAG